MPQDIKEVKFLKKALIVDPSTNRRKLIIQNLEFFTACESVVKNDADAVIEVLKKTPKYDLIISVNMVEEEYTGLKIHYYNKSQRLNIPMILLGNNAKLIGEVTMVEPEKWEEIIKTAGKLMNITAEKMMEIEVPPYYPVNLVAIQELKSAPTNIYRLKNGNYELWKAKATEFKENEIKDLVLSGTSNAYVNKMDRLTFINGSSRAISEILLKENLNRENLSKVAEAAMNNAVFLLKEVGMTEVAVENSRNAIKSISNIIQSTPGIDDMMALISKSKDSYLYRHCLLLSMLGHHTIGHLEWGNKEQKGKVAFAAFFHDITIPEDALCTIHSTEELKAANLSTEDFKKVERHAYQACEVLAKYPDLPFGADNIILQHHGSLNGIGFQDDHLDNRVSPLAIAFRVVEDYVDQLLKMDGKDQSGPRKKIIDHILKKYNKASYKKAAEALKMALTKSSGA